MTPTPAPQYPGRGVQDFFRDTEAWNLRPAPCHCGAHTRKPVLVHVPGAGTRRKHREHHNLLQRLLSLRVQLAPQPHGRPRALLVEEENRKLVDVLDVAVPAAHVSIPATRVAHAVSQLDEALQLVSISVWHTVKHQCDLVAAKVDVGDVLEVLWPVGAVPPPDAPLSNGECLREGLTVPVVVDVG